MTPVSKPVGQAAAELFCSLRLTLVLLLAIAALAVVGTLLPQGELPPGYMEQIGPLRLRIYTALGLFDLYRSWLFIGLLSVFSLHLILCSLKRLPRVFRHISHPDALPDSRHSVALHFRRQFVTTVNADQLAPRLEAVLRSSFSTPRLTRQADQWQLFAQKQPWSRLGVYLVHLSVLLILSGGIIGALFGFDGYLQLAEGQSAGTVKTSSGRTVELGFEVLCNSFRVDFYPDGTPREYRSVLTLSKNGRELDGYRNVGVIVNHPLGFRGIRFYQASYGGTGRYRFILSDPGSGQETPLVVAQGDAARLTDGSTLRVLETTADISRYVSGLSGPAAVVELASPSGRIRRLASYAAYPELNRQHAVQRGQGPILNYQGEQMYTGLKVVRDPGVWWVWSGCLLMLAGLMAAFFCSHRRVWVVIRDGQVAVCGSAHRHQAGFEREFDRLADSVAACLGQED